ncbi:hypothetical protein PTTG_26894 [Puccinia triticina 1-1 BBBD Race 1]|uniref:Uncharacterized protein n=2 Tax=Puccinia triticina TaxID=208348 RepID=A0A180GPS8_PUCT1|nr:uncharacterized protein PtA15_7A465 [Puccinia triticina]OAV94827.1 hypothetical protein PTTG_26894 [Puccinia triticina 1-1 BBBD Race 1]WAQ86737.1 hypothetical protein PtA15_7A465 [Puccinia triticina]WAR56606.1 hypothetical protein PtB15_7B455 [Puccinia triticina]
MTQPKQSSTPEAAGPSVVAPTIEESIPVAVAFEGPPERASARNSPTKITSGQVLRRSRRIFNQANGSGSLEVAAHYPRLTELKKIARAKAEGSKRPRP